MTQFKKPFINRRAPEKSCSHDNNSFIFSSNIEDWYGSKNERQREVYKREKVNKHGPDHKHK